MELHHVDGLLVVGLYILVLVQSTLLDPKTKTLWSYIIDPTGILTGNTIKRSAYDPPRGPRCYILFTVALPGHLFYCHQYYLGDIHWPIYHYSKYFIISNKYNKLNILDTIQ